MEEAQNPANQDDAKNKLKSKRDILVSEMHKGFHDLLVVIQPFQELWSKVPPVDRRVVTIPEELVHAWLSLLLAVVLSRQNESPWQWYMSIAHKLIEEGTQIIMQSRETIQFPFNKAIVQPQDLATLVLSKLAQHVVQLKSSAPPNSKLPGLDIARAYHEHVNRLVSEHLRATKR